MLEVFRAMAAAPSLAEGIEPVGAAQTNPNGANEIETPGWQISRMWHESDAQKHLGVIRRETRFGDNLATMVISGPMFYVGNPLYKSPRSVCRTNADYEVVHLGAVPGDYLTRSNYAPAVERREYLRQLPRCRWNPTKSHVDFYRVAVRAMINLNSERSFINATLPRDVAHVNSVQSIAFENSEDVLLVGTCWASLPYDFLVKVSGRQIFTKMI